MQLLPFQDALNHHIVGNKLDLIVFVSLFLNVDVQIATKEKLSQARKTNIRKERRK